MPILIIECTTANSTPDPGYWKYLALAITCKVETHFTALWDHGRIKFRPIRTLSELLSKWGFEYTRFKWVGQISPLAKSMIAVACRP